MVLIKGQKVIDTKLTGALKDYTSTFSGAVSLSDVRIEFYGDLAQLVNGKLADRNMYVNYLKINNTMYEAEASTVSTSGAWTLTTGCAPGKKSTEWLDCPGAYMTFQ